MFEKERMSDIRATCYALVLPVLDEPVVFARVCTITDSEDTMVKSDWRAEGLVVD